MTEHIPREFIQLLLAKIDLVDLIDNKFPLQKKSNNNHFACCPFHAEKSASFSVSQIKQFYYCFGCGAHGNAIDFLMNYDKLTFPEAIETLAHRASLPLPTKMQSYIKAPVSIHLQTLLKEIALFYHSELKNNNKAIAYLKSRGVTGEIAKTFLLGYAPDAWDALLNTFGKTPLQKQHLAEIGMIIQKTAGGYYDRFRARIMFPIHNKKGDIIGFGGRAIDDSEPKYLNSPETVLFHKGQELYGLYHVLNNNPSFPKVLVVEGYMDVIGLARHDIHYAVATLGTATSKTHLERLLRYTKEIIFCFDGDAAGRNAAWRALLAAIPLIQDDIKIRFLFLPEKEDPDSFIKTFGKEKFIELLQKAHSFAQFFFQTLAKKTDLSDLNGRAHFVKLAKEHLNELRESIFKQMMFDELAKKARIEQHHIKDSEIFIPPKTKERITPPSALRLAMTLLIQEPHLALMIKKPLPDSKIPGTALFKELVALAVINPKITTGQLIEEFRGTAEEKYLVKMAAYAHLTPKDGIEKEFLGAINKLHKIILQQSIDNLLQKAANGSISAEEKALLTNLLQEKVTK